MTRRATLALVKSEPDTDTKPEPLPNPMFASREFQAEASNIAGVMAAVAQRVSGRTTDRAVAQARREMTTLAARLLKLAKSPA